jgi:hypothetical protein
MSALTVLKDATDSGVRISLKGDNLAFKATVRPPPELLAKLREHKAEIVALLRQVVCADPAQPFSPRPTVASGEDARASVNKLLDAMAAENERRREWWNKSPYEHDGSLKIRSAATGETNVIALPKRGRS